MDWKQILGFCIAVLFYCEISAQTNVLEFANLSAQNGLSNSDINAIVQDNDGFIWFGTEYGLNRFDGYEIRFYRNIPGDSTSLPDNSINSLYIDHEGTLWIGTSRGGLAKYLKRSDSFISYHSITSPILPKINITHYGFVHWKDCAALIARGITLRSLLHKKMRTRAKYQST
jgi:hypothetical protein